MRQSCGYTHNTCFSEIQRKKNWVGGKVYKISCFGDGGGGRFVKVLGALIQLNKHNSNATHVNSYISSTK